MMPSVIELESDRVNASCREEGLRRGREEREEEIAASLLQSGLLTVDQIAQATSIPVKKVRRIAKTHGVALA